jgi:hypothetical protein
VLQLSFTVSVLFSHLRSAVSSRRRFYVHFGMGRAGNTARKITICAVPDRNGEKSTFPTAHPPAAREFVPQSTLRVLYRHGWKALSINRCRA